jgi:isopentenyl diphosphate isomerase/L-lactate dehydrogenase-like FMN-dependent dehydrogenase
MQLTSGQQLTTRSHLSLTWDDLSQLRDMTQLPIIVKGLTSPDDARAALDRGVDGVVVSNHGGRRVDGAIAALDALPEVVAAVSDRVPVLFDSGIRTGSDAFKALALGAQAVLLARPYLWGLALTGERGVTHVVRSFLADLDLTFALSGHRTVADCTTDSLRRI